MPKTVRVGPHVYSVLRKPGSGIPDDGLGYCDLNGLQILIRQRLRKSKAQEILTHEILHACTYPALVDEDKRYSDEEFIESMSPVLLRVIQDNPDLLEYLTQ